jgi:hypothetical protein
MAEEDMDSDLEFQLEMLEMRMQNMACRAEGTRLHQSHMRERIEMVDTLRKEIEQGCRILSDLAVQQNVTGESYGAMEIQNESVDVTEERERLGMNEEAAIKIERQVKQMELSVHPLQQTERESRVQESLVRDYERWVHPSMRLQYSDEHECHMIEDPGQVKAGNKVDEPRETKDVRVEQQTDECGNKLIVFVQEVEQLKETEEIDLIKAEEDYGKTHMLDKGLKVKRIVELEGERKSEDIQRKSKEFKIQPGDIAGNVPKDLKDLDKEPKTETSIIMLHGMDRRKYERTLFVGSEKMKRDLSHESRNLSMEKEQHSYSFETTELEEPRDDIEWVIFNELVTQVIEVGSEQEGLVQRNAEEEEEEIEHDYELKMAELEVCFEESELNTLDEMERWISEQAQKEEEIMQSKIINWLKLIIDNIEKKMNARMPNYLRKSVDECFRKIIQFSIKTTKLHIRLLESELRTSNKVVCWLKDERRRLNEELLKKDRKEKSFRELIREMKEYQNLGEINLEASDNYIRQLLRKYDEVTLNIEHELKKHKNMCKEYLDLKTRYVELKAKCESPRKSKRGRDAAGTVEKQEGDRCVAELEEQMSALAHSQEELERTVRRYRKFVPVTGSLDAATVEDYESLDKCRNDLIDALNRQPHLQCEILETALAREKKDHVSSVTCASPWAGSRQRPGIKRTEG